jgi:hypothetical protein
MNKESELTVKGALDQMYDKGIEHAINIVKESMFGEKKAAIAANLVNGVLNSIIEKLEKLKSKP